MATFLFARHGKTEANERHVLQGRKDVPLSLDGKKEIEIIASEIKDRRIDVILSSPLKRAYETAMILRGDRNIAVRICPELIEMDYGSFEGVSSSSEEVHKRYLYFIERYPGGESYVDAFLRIFPFLDRVMEEFKNTDKVILIVAHMGIARIVYDYFNEMTDQEFFSFKMKNGEIKILKGEW